MRETCTCSLGGGRRSAPASVGAPPPTRLNVCGEWLYLFRALDSRGRTVDFYLSQRRDAGAARRFLAKALRARRDWAPSVINTDRNPAYGEAIRKLKNAKLLDDSVDHRQVKYLNNRIEMVQSQMTNSAGCAELSYA
jgi:transposase-like protein